MTTQSDAYQRADGIWVWKSNDAVPFQDMLQSWGFSTEELAAHAAARDAQTAAFLAKYRKVQAEMSPEQKAEQRAYARAAMGPGVDMVNIITGEKFTT